MKTGTTLAIVVLASAAVWTNIRAQDRTSDEVAVRALDEQARIAALSRDVPALERLWSDQLVVNAPNNQVILGKRAVLDDFVRSGIINFSSFERRIEFIRIDGTSRRRWALRLLDRSATRPKTVSRRVSLYAAASRTFGSVKAIPGVCSSATPT